MDLWMDGSSQVAAPSNVVGGDEDKNEGNEKVCGTNGCRANFNPL